jgi:hypothetical protein
MRALRQVTASWFWIVKRIGAARSSSCNRFGPACGVLISNKVIVTWRAVVSVRLNGEDLRPLPLEERRARLQRALRGAGKALRFSEHLKGDGEAIFRHACALGLEGIVSKRRDAR